MRWWLVLLLVACRRESSDLRIATFNIEDFPKNPAQVAGAFDELARTHATVIAVQEIDDPALFANEVRHRLGASWQFVPSGWTTRDHPHHLGVAFDTRRWGLVDTHLHDETTLGGRYRPTLEATLCDGTETIDVFVVHLEWATEKLGCSALWSRDDSCPRSRLDHALTWRRATSATALGPCADGCATTDRCPLYVSDHCPVVISL